MVKFNTLAVVKEILYFVVGDAREIPVWRESSTDGRSFADLHRICGIRSVCPRVGLSSPFPREPTRAHRLCVIISFCRFTYMIF